MPWLVSRPLPASAADTLTRFIGELAEKVDDTALNRSEVVRSTLAEVMYGRSYEDLAEAFPMAALTLDPRNVTFEAEYYVTTDQERFQQVKPLLWLWKNLDLTPLGQSIHSGLEIRRMLARRIFKRVGKNLKVFQNVEFSVGYNVEAGDNVVIHRHAFIDDIGGVVLHDNASLADYVNVYSHTHDVRESPDVTLKQTVIGKGVRVAYHATVLAGTVLSDDAMMGAMALATRDFEPHVIGLGIPAKPRVWKERGGDHRFDRLTVDSRDFEKSPEVRANPDYWSLPPGQPPRRQAEAGDAQPDEVAETEVRPSRR